jgi:prophage DNA circulation protein
MTWRDQLRPASFRGAGFFVDSHEVSGGRKTVAHEYPGRDEPFVEDMGRQSRKFTVDGYIVGEDYFAARNALIDALEANGPGQLVHPYLGEKQVAVTGFRLRESRDEGGMVRFSMDFAETPAQPVQPAAGVDAAGLLGTAADKAQAVETSYFGDFLNVVGQPQFAIDSLNKIVDDAATVFDKALSPVLSGVQAVAKFKASLGQLTTQASSLLRTPLELADRVFALLTDARGFGRSPLEIVRALIVASDFVTGATIAPFTTATRIKERANQDALQVLFRRAAIIEASRTALTVPFVSYEDAVVIRDQLLDRLDVQIDIAPDEVFPALQELRAAVVETVPGIANDLARLIRYTPPQSAPSLTIAHALYGDIDSEADLIARNRIRHPGFVQGGQELKVLSRV